MVFFLFYFFAIMAIFGGVMLILKKNPVINALFLIVVMLNLSGIFLLLGAEFIAAIQVIVYAGAIMVLFLFVIMLLNLNKDQDSLIKSQSHKIIAVMTSSILLVILLVVLNHNTFSVTASSKVIDSSNSERIARLIFGKYLLPFEITSVILLIAIIGVIVLGKKRKMRNLE